MPVCIAPQRCVADRVEVYEPTEELRENWHAASAYYAGQYIQELGIMSPPMSPKSSLVRLWDPQLSDREIYFIGAISVHWASMEHEIFVQTLSTFDSEALDVVKLPKEMNNLQFTGVLALWKERVADKARGRRAKTLLNQYETITKLKVYRDALTHGMWHWAPEDLGAIRTVRVKKREVITTQFSAADLEDFTRRIAGVNFCIRFPGGLPDLAKAQMQQGGYISRRAMAMFAGAPVDGEGFPIGNPPDATSSRPDDI